eukprot:TRINITY_DN32785_c0_g1_i1.p2 TRINITY_DN32785_c0_g1~~TRINITY_DN32785_c0_g1_i1.p2  ORF type:complete len:393 (+),score=115.47 TRINITY_DN32785_c0_g1_i1:88-1266(+)
MRILYITMEYHAQFSGNGTASKSFVRALRCLGHDVFVVCAALQEDTGSLPSSEGVCATVPHWGIHGITGPWREFADRVTQEPSATAIRAWASDATPADTIIAVDWEGTKAYARLAEAGILPCRAPLVYYNYRVFHRNTGNTEEDTAFYLGAEGEACRTAGLTLCLCSTDQASLQPLMAVGSPHVILPGLRDEIRDVARGGGGPTLPRKYLLCCVRVIKEKNARMFADIVGALQSRGSLNREDGTPLIPCMVGSVGDAGYGDAVHSQLRAAVPGCVISGFLPPQELAEVMSASVLNIHPALNEAYGMTIVEAAALGCPSVVHRQDIGAVSLLEGGVEVCLSDMSSVEAAAASIESLLSDPEALRGMAEAARAKALSYGELENAQRLVSLLEAG